MHPPSTIRVVAAVIAQGTRYLLTRRRNGSHLAGYWEFPGGKIEPGETAAQALRRELREEIGVEIRAPRSLTALTHAYPETTVELTFLETEIAGGEPRAIEVDAVGWYEPAEMPGLPILPADLPVVELLESRPARAGGGQGGRDDA